MSTTANVVKLNDNGTADVIVIPIDGYLETDGRILYENYRSLSKLNRLFKVPCIYGLKRTPLETRRDADKFAKIFRQPLTKSLIHFNNLKQAEVADFKYEYVYVWSNGTWYFTSPVNAEHMMPRRNWITISSMLAGQHDIVSEIKRNYRKNGATALLRLYLHVQEDLNLVTTNKQKQSITDMKRRILGYARNFLEFHSKYLGTECVVDSPRLLKAIYDYRQSHSGYIFLRDIKPICDKITRS